MWSWVPRLVWSAHPFFSSLASVPGERRVLRLTRVGKCLVFYIPLTAVVTTVCRSVVYALFPFQNLAGKLSLAHPWQQQHGCMELHPSICWCACPSIHVLLFSVTGVTAELRTRQGGHGHHCSVWVKRCRQRKRDLYLCENGLSCHSAAWVDDPHTREESGLQWLHFYSCS